MKMSLSERSPIQNFYKNSRIFITGASGFLGTALLEKLIRSCPDINTIYILMRNKRNKTKEERLEEIFDNHIWDTVRAQNPNYKNYIKIINGDLLCPKLGISDEDYSELSNKVNVIFHVAATVRFDEPIKRAAKINIEATRYVLELAKTCKQLKAVVHVSTAYSQCILPVLKEQFYMPQRDPEEFITYCEQHSLEYLDEILPSILGKYPNTYTFTKGLGENMVQKYEKELPVAICRPSIVFGCAEEPIEGWIKGVFGPVGTLIGIGMGILHVIPCNMDTLIDIIPADICVNQMIVVAYETAKQPKKTTIYNCVSGSDNPITWREYWHWILTFAHGYACLQSLWYYFIIFTSNKKLFKIYQVLFHTIPAHIVDACLKLTGKKPKLIKIYEKVHKMTELLFIFFTTQWVFHSDNTRQLYENLNPVDQKLFSFDVRKIVWDVYLWRFVRYGRINILKEPATNVVEAQKRIFKLKVAHYSLIFVFIALFYWVFSVICKLFV